MILPLTLESVAQAAHGVESVQRGDLAGGDWLVVTTRNSIYSIYVLDEDTYVVSGGWFDERFERPLTLRINGCTCGGSAILHDLVAAPGLFLEFANGVLTTRIQSVRVFRHGDQGAPC